MLLFVREVFLFLLEDAPCLALVLGFGANFFQAVISDCEKLLTLAREHSIVLFVYRSHQIVQLRQTRVIKAAAVRNQRDETNGIQRLL